MAHTMSKHTQVRKNLTKAEFQLFAGSFPKELTKKTRRSLNSAVLKTEMLVRKYRTAQMKSSQKSTAKNAQKKMSKKMMLAKYRLNSLTKAHDRYLKKLDRMDHKYAKMAKIKTPKKARSERKSMTPQRKMLVDLQDSPRERFLNGEKKKMYSRQTKLSRQQNSAGRLLSKRIAGYMKARTRKGQVARDRVTSAKDD